MTEKWKNRRKDQKKDITIYDLESQINELQEKLSPVTEMAFVTVDYRGMPVTKMTGFSSYCGFRRKYDYYEKNCFLSNAFGGATAAIRNKPYIYQCHAGLVHIAVPVVIRQQYMGTLIGGQVRCLDAPELDHFQDRINDDVDWTKEKSMQEWFDEIPIMSYQKIEQAAELIFLCVNHLCETETLRIEKEIHDQQQESLKEEYRKIQEKEKRMEDYFLSGQDSHTLMNARFVLNNLSLAAGLACVEDAEQTEEMIHLLIQMIRYRTKEEKQPVLLKEELAHIENYLKIQKFRFEEKLDYEIVKGDHLKEQTILPNILLPFVENAVIHGVLARKGEGKIRISCYREKGDCVIQIDDEGGDQSVWQMELLDLSEEYHEKSRVNTDIYAVRQRLMEQYGKAYDIHLFSNGEGTRTVLKIPQSIERILRNV